MYGLPPNVDLTFFAGKMLLQVCVGANDLILNFDGGVSITITSSVTVRSLDGKRETSSKHLPSAGPSLFQLLNRHILGAKEESAGTLSLEFEDGSRVEIHDDSRDFESYVIRNRERTIVV